MTNYRRSNIARASYFFTVNLADRSQALLTENIALLRSAFEYIRGNASVDALRSVTQERHKPQSIHVVRCAHDSEFVVRTTHATLAVTSCALTGVT